MRFASFIYLPIKQFRLSVTCWKMNMNKTGFFRRYLLPLILLVICIIFVYSNSLNGSFQFDDQQIIDRPNLHITDLSVDSLIGTFFFKPQGQRIYRPLSNLTLGLNYYFGKDDPFGYHVVNITIHILCSIAVYVFLQTLLSIPAIKPSFPSKHRYAISTIAAFLFALHPIQTNVATYIIQRMASLAALFYIISITGYIFFRMQTLEGGKGTLIRKYAGLLIAVISGICSFLSKENAAFLPITMLLLDYLFFYNLFDENQRKKLKRIYAVSIFLVMATIAYAGTGRIMDYIHGYGHRDFSLMERLLTEPRIIFFYIYLLFIPNTSLLNLNHDILISKSIINPPTTLFAIAGIILLVILAYTARKKYNLLTFVILWYLGNLVIESTLIPLELIFEHRTYLPGVLVFFLMSFGIVYVSMNVLNKDKAILFTSLLLILYGNGTYLRNFVFRTPISMWQDIVKKSPNLARAHANLGRAYMDFGFYSEAKKELETAIRINPNSMEPVINLAKLNMNYFNRDEMALALFKKALRLAPESAYTCKGLGDIYNKLENYKKADHFYTVAVKRMPFLTSAINNLAITKIFLNKKDEAIVVFKYGIKVDPTHADLNTNLAKLYADKKMFAQAVKTLEIFLAKNRDFRPGYELLQEIKHREISAELSESDA